MSILDLIIGRRLASTEQKGQKIGVFFGLPAFGLDGLSSSAYGPEAALTFLLPLGAAGLRYIGPITLVILLLLTLLYFSYRQTIAAYPVNGGSYTVAKENLGTWPSLFAGAALMIDYILTVAVGISAGIAALVSAVPMLHHYTVPMCLGVLALIALLNLRGTGEAGAAFALPTYLFIACMTIVLVLGLIRWSTTGGHPHPVVPPPPLANAVEGVSLWLLLRAFSSGCAAMTGVEAVSNGVSAFKDPPVVNAHRTLTCIVAILAMLLGGIALLCHGYNIGAMDQEKHGYQSVLSQLTGAIVGRGWFYDLTMACVLAVLCLSANTSFVDFPRLCRLIAEDDFLPRSFAAMGRRLVYSVGVIVLAGLAGILLAVFRGITDKLIPLYAVGAFLAFTLSQTGMVVHKWKQLHGQLPLEDETKNDAPSDKKPARVGARSYLGLGVSATGAIATSITLVTILVAKFTEGAWITVVAIPSIIILFWQIHRHYARIIAQLVNNRPLDLSNNHKPVVVVPMYRWSKPIAKSLRFAMHLSDQVIAVHLSKLQGDEADDENASVRDEWRKYVEEPARAAGLTPPKLEFVNTPYRQFVTPLVEQIDRIKSGCHNQLVAVIIPEVVETHWWMALLHSRRASRLRSALRSRKDFRVVVIDLPWFVSEDDT
jgi:amino acid transporter